jgi:hypothetical protein
MNSRIALATLVGLAIASSPASAGTVSLSVDGIDGATAVWGVPTLFAGGSVWSQSFSFVSSDGTARASGVILARAFTTLASFSLQNLSMRGINDTLTLSLEAVIDYAGMSSGVRAGKQGFDISTLLNSPGASIDWSKSAAWEGIDLEAMSGTIETPGSSFTSRRTVRNLFIESPVRLISATSITLHAGQFGDEIRPRNGIWDTVPSPSTALVAPLALLLTRRRRASV